MDCVSGIRTAGRTVRFKTRVNLSVFLPGVIAIVDCGANPSSSATKKHLTYWLGVFSCLSEYGIADDVLRKQKSFAVRSTKGA